MLTLDGSADGAAIFKSTITATGIIIGSTAVTSTAAELNILDGVTSTAAELNILDGVTSTAAELNILDGVTSTAAELNILDGVTSTAAELNVLDGITAVVGELNALDLGSTAVGNAIASKAVILDSNKDYTGIRNFTIDGDLDVGDDLFLTSDTAKITFGADSEITLEHRHEYGLKITNTVADTDGRPVELLLKSEEDAIVADDVIASILMQAGDSDGQDGHQPFLLVSMRLLKEHSRTSANPTKLVFTTGVSESAANAAATAKMTLSSAGLLTIADDLVIKDGGTIGVASDADAITIASNGQVTLTQTLIGTALDISGDVDVDGTLEADAITVNGTALAEFISDTAGAMVSSNTETGIAVTYQDADNTIDFAINAAQTTITSLLATDIKIGEDDQTKIDFETADEIHFYAANAHQVKIVDGAIVPATDDDVDLGTSSAEFKNAFFDGTVTSDAFAGPLTGDVTGTSSKVTVTNSTANTNFPVVFNDESDSLLDDTGALRYNPSSGTLLVPNLVVAGTTTQVDTVTMNAQNAVVFEGATADDHETTLTIIDPTGDRTINLPNVSGTIPVLAAASTTQVTSTPEELNILDGATVVVGEINALDLGSTAVGNAIASKAVILDSNKDYTGVRNFTLSGELDAGSLDVSGDVDVDGTLEADAITVNGTALAEFISDTAGAMVSSNTETGIAVTYQDADNTIDFAINAAQTTITSLLATDIKIGEDDQTKIDFETADEIHFYANNANEMIVQANVVAPGADDGTALGDANQRWSDLFLASGAVINFDNGDVTATHSSNTLTIAGGTLATAALTTSTIVASGIIKTDDSTEATSTTDGSLQTDGGLSVVKDIVAGDDIKLLSDAAVIHFGTNSEITATHVHNVGLTLTHTATGDNTPMVLQLKSEEDAIIANEVIASLEFAAGDSDGTDGATVAAGIHAIAEGTFSASANATKLVFTTGVSETAASSATAKATLSSIGDFQVAGDLVVKDGGLIGSASDLDAIAIASNGVVTFSQIPLLPDNTVSTGDLQADAVTGAKIADNAINSEHYTDGSIDTAHIADDQVTQAKMANDSVGSAEMKTLSTLLIKNSGGTTLKTLHAAGA